MATARVVACFLAWRGGGGGLCARLHARIATPGDTRHVCSPQWALTPTARRHSGFFHVDFANTALRAAASSLAPATLRVGGTGGDYLHYGGFAGSEPCPAASSSANDTYGCLNTTHWADLVGLADTVGDLLFGLSYDAERACGGGAGAGAAYEWRADAAQGALRLLRHAAASGQRIWGVELGNELNNLNRADRQACGLRAEHHAEALITLQKVLEGVYQNASDRPVVIGPDSGGYECIGVGGCPWLEDCLDALRASERGVDGTLHAVTHHTYPGIASDSYDSASELDQKHAIDQWLVPLVRQRAAKAQVWSGETGPHSGGENGTCGADAASICGKFGSALWYADDLGYRATRGISQHQRQDLFGGRYGLLRIKRGAEALFADDSVSLSADFWVNYLWKRLVGRAVGGTVLEETYGNTLRAYCHAGAPQSPDAPPEAAGATATLVLINLSPSEGREVTLGVAPLGGGRTTVDALAWSLSPPIAGALSFDAPLLNGQALPAALTVGGKGLAGMQAPAKRIPAGGTIALPPHSVTFALLLDSKSRAMS